jgi:hypothetical protein
LVVLVKYSTQITQMTKFEYHFQYENLLKYLKQKTQK